MGEQKARGEFRLPSAGLAESGGGGGVWRLLILHALVCC